MKLKILLSTAIFVFAMPLVASGSNSSQPKVSSNDRSYEIGERQFKASVTCKKCAYPKGIESKAQARQAFNRISRNEIKVEPVRKKDLLQYIRLRYKL